MADDRFTYIHHPIKDLPRVLHASPIYMQDLAQDDIDIPPDHVPFYEAEEDDTILPSHTHPSYPFGNPYKKAIPRLPHHAVPQTQPQPNINSSHAANHPAPIHPLPPHVSNDTASLFSHPHSSYPQPGLPALAYPIFARLPPAAIRRRQQPGPNWQWDELNLPGLLDPYRTANTRPGPSDNTGTAGLAVPSDGGGDGEANGGSGNIAGTPGDPVTPMAPVGGQRRRDGGGADAGGAPPRNRRVHILEASGEDADGSGEVDDSEERDDQDEGGEEFEDNEGMEEGFEEDPDPMGSGSDNTDGSEEL